MTTPTPHPDREAEIEARLKALIPNPWNWRWVLPGQSEIEIVGMRDGDESNEWESLLQMFVNNGAKKQAMANATFICKSKDDLSYLLEENRRLRGVLESVKRYPGPHYLEVAAALNRSNP